jgi:SAM-dependent methyltransferase
MDPSQYDLMYRLEDKHWWFLAKRQFIKSILPPPSGKFKILDLGAGTGGLSAFLKKWGQVECIEGSPRATQYLKKRKLNYRRQDLNKWNPKPNLYDLVSICDVLYHQNIYNDQSIIVKAYSALKSKGLLIITDSAIPILFSHHDQIMHTRKRYFLPEMKNMVKHAGFSILKASYIYFTVFPFFAATRFIDKIIPINSVSQPANMINNILLAICNIESKMFKHIDLPIGSSILVLAQKHETK